MEKITVQEITNEIGWLGKIQDIYFMESYAIAKYEDKEDQEKIRYTGFYNDGETWCRHCFSYVTFEDCILGLMGKKLMNDTKAGAYAGKIFGL